ncbi:hypothetical protein EVAR_90002_1 [Eumeta japonica]|uniref:CCHC-type domain-containing protein n=1 Tax=Eumeta variegata TaxID=151549 RepID=A0A4C2ACU3_EUMVA|nr:hypothetical protein EVAR_90002_1 [Eumeta japonica]
MLSQVPTIWSPGGSLPLQGHCCGKCGEIGHKTEECKATVARCATCHRFGRRDAEAHRTASRIAQHESSRKSDTYPSPDMDKRGGLRVGQINLGGSVVATRELPRRHGGWDWI